MAIPILESAPKTTTPFEEPTAELLRLRASLEHAQRLATLGTIAGLIAHEFNNLLTPVMSYAQMAMDDPGNAALTKKALERAAEGAERASQIATAILDFAKQDLEIPPAGASGSGLESLEAGRVDVGAAVKSMFSCLARDPAKDGVRFTFHGEHAGTALMRPVALQQILLNLVLNAKRAMAPTGGDLAIRASRTPNAPAPMAGDTVGLSPAGGYAGPWITIEVQDTGKGIDGKSLGSIFRPFVTSAKTPTTDRSGTGLGLTVCQQLLAQAGGGIWVRSTVGVGTVFTVVVRAA